MNPLPRVLLLSGASLVGQNVLACLSSRRQSLRLAATNSTADEPVLFDFDAVYLTPEVRREPEAYARRFGEVLAHFGPDLVIPCRDDDVSFLAHECLHRPAMRDRFICGDAALATAMLDKLESARLSARLGLPFAPTLGVDGRFDAARRFAAEHGYPLVCKPRRGFASRGVRLIIDERQLERACAQPDQVLQKYCGDGDAVRQLAEDSASSGIALFHTLEGIKLSIQASITRAGTVGRVFATGNAMRFGRSESVHVVDDAQVIATGTRWAGAFAQAGWRGPLNIQGHRANDGAITIFEYNGRFTGATAARRLLGFDEVGMVLQDWLGVAPATVDPAAAQKATCYLSGRALDRVQIERLQRDAYWAASESRTARAGEP